VLAYFGGDKPIPYDLGRVFWLTSLQNNKLGFGGDNRHNVHFADKLNQVFIPLEQKVTPNPLNSRFL
jgi:hypothetical protein